MSPEMLMQPFEQTFNFVPSNNYYSPHNNSMIENDATNYYLGYPPHQPHLDTNEDFRTAFYNPFEIKHRRRTSRAQLKVLEKSFDENPKPNATTRRLLAQQLDMTPRGVQIWFQNRRAKAKLQRRKSGQDENSTQEQEQKEQPNNSPALFNQFFNNLKAWDKSMRSAASLSPSPCVLNSFGSAQDENWLKTPIHPLAPVIESDSHFTIPSTDFVSSEEWRRKSCPSLIAPRCLHPTNHRLSYPTWPSSDNGNTDIDRNATHMNLYSSLNCSPLSQELTPMLSTGSPVSSVDGTYIDPCLDLLIAESSSAPSSTSAL